VENEAKLFVELLRYLEQDYGVKNLKEIEKYWLV
jgi:hypothetical protein